MHGSARSSVPDYFKWLSYLSWFKYGDEALLINQWEGVEEIACTRSNATCPRTGHVVLETLSFREVSDANSGIDLINSPILWNFCLTIFFSGLSTGKLLAGHR